MTGITNDERAQLTALAVLDYVMDLFTDTPREQFSRDEILIVLSTIRNDHEVFDQNLVARMDAAAARIEAEARES